MPAQVNSRCSHYCCCCCRWSAVWCAVPVPWRVHHDSSGRVCSKQPGGSHRAPGWRGLRCVVRGPLFKPAVVHSLRLCSRFVVQTAWWTPRGPWLAWPQVREVVACSNLCLCMLFVSEQPGGPNRPPGWRGLRCAAGGCSLHLLV